MDIEARAREAGVTTEDGQPLHPLLARTVETVIASGLDSEPLRDASRAVLLAHPRRVLEGLALALEATRARQGILVVPDGDLAVTEALESVRRDFRQVRIQPLPLFHPASEPRVLAREVVGVDVPGDTSLQAVGVLVVDTQALYHLAEACDGRPATHRFVTVAGEVARPGTVRVPLGAFVSDIIGLCGGVVEGAEVAFVKRGPLHAVPADLEDTLDRGDTALAVLPAGHPAVERAQVAVDTMVQRARAVCGGCRLCTEACPQHNAGHAIQPHLLMRAMAHGLSTIDDVVLGAGGCVGCLACASVCPAGLAPGRVYASVKAHLRARGVERIPVGPVGPPREAAGARKPPRSRLARWLGVSKYDRRFPVDDNYYQVSRVRLGADFGAPRVAVGDRVVLGDLVVASSEEGLPVHAPISGVVTLLEGPGGSAPAAGGQTDWGNPVQTVDGRAPNGVVEIHSA